MKLENLELLLGDMLKDLYSAEKQIVKGLPKMAKSASSPTLKALFQEHTEVSKRQAQRLEQAAETMGIKLRGKTCAAMEGLLEEAKEILDMGEKSPIVDCALVGAAQKVEHYEISGYGTARTIAEKLGLNEVAALLQETLEEESETDERLTGLSTDELLDEAMMGEEEEAEEEVEDVEEEEVVANDEEEEAPKQRRSSGGRRK